MDAAIVRRVFALGKQTILTDSGTRIGDILGVLVRNALAALVVLFGVLRSPPIAQVALSVKFASLIVEAMREFVADNHANGAVIHGIVHRLFEEWRLQNAGGEIDGI